MVVVCIYVCVCVRRCVDVCGVLLVLVSCIVFVHGAKKQLRKGENVENKSAGIKDDRCAH